MTVRQKLWFWAATLGLFIAALVLLKSVLLPFVAGMAIAYFLDPLADRLERQGLSRTLATTVLTVGFFIVLILLAMMLVPLLVQQLESLAVRLPGYFESARLSVATWSALLKDVLSPEDLARVRDAVGGASGQLFRWLLQAASGVLQSGQAVLSLLSLLVITPVVAFYLLRDWDRLTARVDGWLPRDNAGVIRAQLHAIDRTLAGFARGQATVCLILAGFYGMGLTLAGLEFGLIVGMMAGLASFVPFVGSIGGIFLSVGLALLQFDDTWRVLVIAAIFIVGQAVEGNYLTPKLVGDRVGLHAVWVMFALVAGGALFGFVGVLLAVPVAAVIGVLARFALTQYMASPLYRGHGGSDSGPAA
ncbi:MAG: AI-2E family transporter [Alphaproteobacteria bacterium]|nr:AI-2E family transporter [Alphaproteobacteria bacterium]